MKKKLISYEDGNDDNEYVFAWNSENCDDDGLDG